MSMSSLNIRVLRSESIGSISAWLPSRRSTAHQIGGLVITAFGHLRSLISTGLYGTYFSPAWGILGFWDDMVCCDFIEGVRTDDNATRKVPQLRGGGSANKSKRRQSEHCGARIGRAAQESTVRSAA